MPLRQRPQSEELLLVQAAVGNCRLRILRSRAKGNLMISPMGRKLVTMVRPAARVWQLMA